MPTLKTLVSFSGADGSTSYVGLASDANGDLFGTTSGGGANGFGTVFEIAKIPTGYASTPTTLVNFGTVLEIAKTPTGYASTPTILLNFDDNCTARG